MQQDLIFFRLSSDTLTDQLKDITLARAKDMVDLQDEVVDSAAVGDSFKFTGLHLGAWNKMALSVCDQHFSLCVYAEIKSFCRERMLLKRYLLDNL